MKILFVLVLLLVGTTIIAQERTGKHQGNKMEPFTPEQQNQLMLKKMTLELDLTESQQKEMMAFISDKRAKKEAHRAEMKAMKEKGVKPTNEERFAHQMKMLDEQMASKKRMEKILNAKQFEKWTSIKEDRKDNRHDKPQSRNQGKHPEKRQG